MKYLPFIIFILLLCIVQVTLLDDWKFFGARPDFLLIAVVIASLFFPLRWAIILSLLGGIAKDVFGASAVGVNAVLFVLWSYLISRVKKNISMDSPWARLGLIAAVALLNNIATGISLMYLGNTISAGIFFRNVILESLYTVFCFPVILMAAEPLRPSPQSYS